MHREVNEAGVNLLAQRINELVDLFAKKAPGFLFKQIKNGTLVLNKGLPDYVESNFMKCETVRTLLRRDSPTLLEAIYEPHRFEFDQTEISEAELHDNIGRKLIRTVVVGKAGSGKSVFLKRLFRKSVEVGITYYPIFFELRTFSTERSHNLLDNIYYSIANFSDGFTKAQFEFGLKRGLFFLMIDALDEAPSQLREEISSEIQEVARKYPLCPIVVTSRPSDEFHSWEGFYEASLLPFSEEQCISYISKIDFPDERKLEFLDFLKSGGFVKHEEFLSNPLLASMMLLTYDEYGDIPRKRHVFYEKCFQVLLREHDSSKGKYRREFKSRLSHEDIENIFMYFCTLSYLDDAKPVFTISEVLSFIDDALQASGHVADPQEVCADFVDAVSILQRDGNAFEFSHRSFQEFFFARYVVSDRDATLLEKIEEIKDMGPSDGLLGMIADMDRVYFEREALLPVARRVFQQIGRLDPWAFPDRIIGKFFARVGVDFDFSSGAEQVVDELGVYYAVSHGVREYKPRKMNLILLDFFSEYVADSQWRGTSKKMPPEEMLKIFRIKDIGSRKDKEFIVGASNRERMIALGCGVYAEQIVQNTRNLIDTLDRKLAVRASKLSRKIREK